MTDHDHLAAWLRVRATVPWRDARAAPTVPAYTPVRDGAAHDVRAFDHARDPARAIALLAALDRVRADAAGTPLTFALLAGWQRLVLGAPAVFRTVPAYAKDGRERYGTTSREVFDACLAESADPALPLAARAARAYLDVCFFHPFADGNARSAFLTLVFVLAREGVVLDQVGPVRRTRRRADVPGDALALADLVASLVVHARRRSAAAYETEVTPVSHPFR